jgi:hypothetical protein
MSSTNYASSSVGRSSTIWIVRSRSSRVITGGGAMCSTSHTRVIMPHSCVPRPRFTTNGCDTPQRPRVALLDEVEGAQQGRPPTTAIVFSGGRAPAEERRPVRSGGQDAALHSPLRRAGSAPDPMVEGLPDYQDADAPKCAPVFLAHSSRDAARAASEARRSSWARRRVSAHRLRSVARSAIRSARSSANVSRCAFQPLRRSMAPYRTMHSFPGTRNASRDLVDRQRHRADRPIRPAHPCAGTPGPNRRPKTLDAVPKRLPPGLTVNLLQRVTTAIRANSDARVRHPAGCRLRRRKQSEPDVPSGAYSSTTSAAPVAASPSGSR